MHNYDDNGALIITHFAPDTVAAAVERLGRIPPRQLPAEGDSLLRMNQVSTTPSTWLTFQNGGCTDLL